MYADVRKKSGLFNLNYRMLDKEFSEKIFFSKKKEKLDVEEPLLKRMLKLTYTPTGDNVDNYEFDLSAYRDSYQSSDSVEHLDVIIKKICGNNFCKVEIEECTHVRNLKFNRCLPLVVGYILKNGINNILTESQHYDGIVKLVAFWVLELYKSTEDFSTNEQLTTSSEDSDGISDSTDEGNHNKTMQENFIEELYENAYEDLIRNGNDFFDKSQKNLIVNKSLNEFVELIKKLFPKYLRYKTDIITNEVNALYKEIEFILN